MLHMKYLVVNISWLYLKSKKHIPNEISVPSVGHSFVKPSADFKKLVPIISVIIAISKYIYGIKTPPLGILSVEFFLK
ncbi:Uncharacterised protein [Staphylococcus aureus]|nr:Uncharacterised protein [Staphylococcus aureus]